MNRAADILWGLLRQGYSSQLESVTAQDWNAVIDLAFEQGVAAVSVDCYNHLLQECKCENILLETDENLEDLKVEWFGSVLQAEEDYRKQLEVAKSLAERLKAHGMDTIVLKGFSCAEKYPIPNHREWSDLDVYIKNENGDIVSIIGGEVLREDYKHVGFKYKGEVVEWHKCLTAWKSLKNGSKIENVLHKALENSELKRIADSDLLEADDLFNSLFLTVHAYTHFLMEDGITLRHIFDWGMVIKDENMNVDLFKKYEEICRELGMWRFASSMTRIAKYVYYDDSVSLTVNDHKLLDDILCAGRRKKMFNDNIQIAYNILFRNRWKFKAFANEGNVACLMRNIKNKLKSSTVL